MSSSITGSTSLIELPDHTVTLNDNTNIIGYKEINESEIRWEILIH